MVGSFRVRLGRRMPVKILNAILTILIGSFTPSLAAQDPPRRGSGHTAAD